MVGPTVPRQPAASVIAARLPAHAVLALEWRTCSDRCDDGMRGGGLSDTETAANQSDKDGAVCTADVVAEKGL